MHIFAHLKYSNVKSSQKKTTMQKCIKLHLKCHLGPENVSILFYLYLGQKKVKAPWRVSSQYSLNLKKKGKVDGKILAFSNC